MFSESNYSRTKILIFRSLFMKNHVVKNRLKCSDFKYANYKFVVSLYIVKRLLSVIIINRIRRIYDQKECHNNRCSRKRFS